MNAMIVSAADAPASPTQLALQDVCRPDQIAGARDVLGPLLSCLAEDIPAGILVAYGAPDFPIVLVNRMAEALLGCRRENLLGTAAGARVNEFELVPSDSLGSAGEHAPLYRTAHRGEALRDEDWAV